MSPLAHRGGQFPAPSMSTRRCKKYLCDARMDMENRRYDCGPHRILQSSITTRQWEMTCVSLCYFLIWLAKFLIGATKDTSNLIRLVSGLLYDLVIDGVCPLWAKIVMDMYLRRAVSAVVMRKESIAPWYLGASIIGESRDVYHD